MPRVSPLRKLVLLVVLTIALLEVDAQFSNNVDIRLLQQNGNTKGFLKQSRGAASASQSDDASPIAVSKPLLSSIGRHSSIQNEPESPIGEDRVLEDFGGYQLPERYANDNDSNYLEEGTIDENSGPSEIKQTLTIQIPTSTSSNTSLEQTQRQPFNFLTNLLSLVTRFLFQQPSEHAVTMTADKPIATQTAKAIGSAFSPATNLSPDQQLEVAVLIRQGRKNREAQENDDESGGNESVDDDDDGDWRGTEGDTLQEILRADLDDELDRIIEDDYYKSENGDVEDDVDEDDVDDDVDDDFDDEFLFYDDLDEGYDNGGVEEALKPDLSEVPVAHDIREFRKMLYGDDDYIRDEYLKAKWHDELDDEVESADERSTRIRDIDDIPDSPTADDLDDIFDDEKDHDHPPRWKGRRKLRASKDLLDILYS